MHLTRRRVLALVVLSGMLLLTLDARGSATIDSAKSVFASIFSPFKGVGRMIATPVRNAWHGATNYAELERENDALREQLAMQEGDSIAAQAALRDYQELVAQTDLPSLSSFTNVTAQVVAYSATNVQQTIEINKGRSRGLRVGMPVANAAGLVGKVVEVYDQSALVLLISDPSYSVTVRVVGTQPIPGSAAAATAGVSPTGAAIGTAADPAADPAGDPAAEAATEAATESATESGTEAATEPATEPVPEPDGDPAAEASGGPADPAAAAGETAATAPPSGAVSTDQTATGATNTTTPVALDVAGLPLRERGSLEGVGPGKRPVVRFINNDAKANRIQVGDLVVTDGGKESLAPAGLNIGRVAKVTRRAGAAGPIVEVEPAAELADINYVRVIMYLPESELPAG